MIVNPEPNRRPMDKDGIRDLLERAETGRLATISPDGTPYIVPVHFVFDGERIYFHCAMKGKKLENILINPSVCFEADELLEIFMNEETPCSNDTFYRSVIAKGLASVVDDNERKLYALGLLMNKHSKSDNTYKFPIRSLDATCIVEITVTEISGKKHER
ncbi:hypothetical protein CUJ83_13045 [Methanocella sp. CWC-04]|uniref:Nitroimidazol reductase NimA, pyridoxamine 5'-phosphate oxidase superfamily n=1 Tax=Methanooceanicella nereidis TaxID=2052831 RepID=A0AAP2RGR4_9EURY|nr:pyridoxamine 5'-phosphate oxidase family protein [Methanocella sp. CWC-04]MCD1295922.1 hypothetical protein [Methanocella sp. CWC-04]